jgi:primosomal protein N' (replication factor Y)
VKLTVALADRDEAQAAGEALVEQLRTRAAATGERVDVAGPAPAFVARRGERWRFNVVLRGPDPVRLLADPPGAPWSIDVDPESLL